MGGCNRGRVGRSRSGAESGGWVDVIQAGWMGGVEAVDRGANLLVILGSFVTFLGLMLYLNMFNHVKPNC